MDLYEKVKELDLQIQQLNNTKQSIQNVINSQGYKSINTFRELFFKAWGTIDWCSGIDMAETFPNYFDSTDIVFKADEKMREIVRSEETESGFNCNIEKSSRFEINKRYMVIFDYKGWLLAISRDGSIERIKIDSDNNITHYETLVSMSKDTIPEHYTFSIFRSGDFLTFVKEKFIDVLIAKELEKDSKKEIEKIEDHSNRHRLIEDF